MDTGTQTAPDNIVDGEFTETNESQAMEKRQASLSIRHEVSPEQFKAEIENRRALKKILLDYVRNDLSEGSHFYYASKFGKKGDAKPNDGEKPSLTKEGALTVCHTLKCFPGKSEFQTERHHDGHITVIVDACVCNQDGVVIATGRGVASTREGKYRYRWCYEKDVPRDLDKNLLQVRSGQGWKQYRIENPDIADLENTVTKMAEKRAIKGAVDKLPIVSDIFAPSTVDPDDDENSQFTMHNAQSSEAPRTQTTKDQNRNSTNSKPAQQTAPSPAEQTSSEVAESVQTALTLSTKLQKEHGVHYDELATQFLPVGVGKFSDLTEEQAAVIVPGLAELLTAKVNAK